MLLVAWKVSGAALLALMEKAVIPSSPGGPSWARISGSVFTRRTEPRMTLMPDGGTSAAAATRAKPPGARQVATKRDNIVFMGGSVVRQCRVQPHHEPNPGKKAHIIF